jgi:hypothetical protein
LADASPAFASGGLTKGDAAILRLVAAIEIIETDIWQQYNELAGIQDSEVPGGSDSPAYTDAVTILDSDMAQYIHTTPKTRSATSPSSTRTCKRTARHRSTWTSSAPCRAARRRAPSRSDG